MYRAATDEEKKRFEKACFEVMCGPGGRDGGIGTLGEKTLHAVLKRFYEPDGSCREVKIGSYYADIAKDGRITEIQTRSLDKLREKLKFFLRDHEVTVVYPVAAVKSLSWIGADGACGKKRKSPKKGTVHDAYRELYKLRPMLTNPGLHIRIVLLDITEYRFLNGWSRDGKRGSSRCERIPNAVIGQLYIQSPEEFADMIPDSLGERFLSSDFAKAAGISRAGASTALNIFNFVGAVKRVGKSGNAYIYERT